MLDAARQNDIIRKRKYPIGRIKFAHKGNNHNFKVASFAVQDDDSIAIPGLTVQIEYRIPAVVPRVKYHFTLLYLARGRKRRLYQLEVQPTNKKTSHANGPIYGPHEHFMDHDCVRPLDLSLPVEHYQDWLAEFCKRTNLVIDEELPQPFGMKNELPLADQ